MAHTNNAGSWIGYKTFCYQQLSNVLTRVRYWDKSIGYGTIDQLGYFVRINLKHTQHECVDVLMLLVSHFSAAYAWRHM